MNDPNKSPQQQESRARDWLRVKGLRRLQIFSVAVGSAFTILFLVCISLELYTLAWGLLIGFVLTLVMVLVLGVLAWWKFG